MTVLLLVGSLVAKHKSCNKVPSAEILTILYNSVHWRKYKVYQTSVPLLLLTIFVCKLHSRCHTSVADKVRKLSYY